MSRTRVAVVATTAETVIEDTRRALGLLGPGLRRPAESVVLAVATPSPGLPGAGAKPWQWAAWQDWLADNGQPATGTLEVVGSDRSSHVPEFDWLRKGGVRVEDCPRGDGALCDSSSPLVSAAWAAAPRRRNPSSTRGVLLGSLSASRRWGVRGASALLCDAMRASRPWPVAEADAEAVAELARLYAEDFDRSVYLLDATVCGTDSRRLRPMVLDLIVAGTDAVAVDAVGALLLGWQPRSIAWLQRLEEEGLGTLDLSQVDVVGGGVELSSLLASAKVWRPARRRASLGFLSRLGEWAARAYHALLWRPWVGRPIRRLYERTPWGRLDADCRTSFRSSG